MDHEQWTISEQMDDIIKDFQKIKISAPPPPPTVPKQIQLEDTEVIDLLAKVWVVENWLSTGEGVCGLFIAISLNSN